MVTLLDRLADKFLVGDGCWEWVAAIGGGGYGVVRNDGRQQAAHRVLYEIMVGPIPAGLQLDHLCRNRRCVRPGHLEPVTCGENIRRGTAGGIRGAQQQAKTHCPAGHAYDEDNTRLARGRRICRACDNSRKRAAQ